MANTITAYNPVFYANEALIVLENALGMANRVYRAYETERNSFGLGDTINIRKPSSLEVKTGGTSNTSDVVTEQRTITLNQWKQVKISLTDQEISKTGERIIEEHIQPASYALANQIDTDLMGLFTKVPWRYGVAGASESNGLGKNITDITAPRRILAKNAGRQVDIDQGNIHLGVRPEVEENFIGNEIFYSSTVVGGTQNQQALLNGSLGPRFGVEVFRSHNVGNHTSGTVISATTSGGAQGALNGAASKGASSIAVNGFAGTETFKIGDTILIAGNDQRYVVTADQDLAGGAATLSISPNLVQDYVDTAVVSAADGNDTVGDFSDRFYGNMLFHRNAFALCVAPLPQTGDGAGAQMATVTDDQTNLSIRSRVAYDDASASVKVTLDILYGIQCIEPNLAVVIQENYV